jgi:hypothetical protein
MELLRVGDREIRPHVRSLREMQSVIFDKAWLRTADLDQPLYLMYRDGVLPQDRQIAQQLQDAL